MFRRLAIPGRGFGLVVKSSIQPRTLLLTSRVFVPGKTRRERLAALLNKRQDPNFTRVLNMARVEGICRAETTPALLAKHPAVPPDEIFVLMDILGTNDHGIGSLPCFERARERKKGRERKTWMFYLGPGFWIEPTSCNHSCQPNSRFHLGSEELLSIVTTKSLRSGEVKMFVKQPFRFFCYLQFVDLAKFALCNSCVLRSGSNDIIPCKKNEP